MARRRGAIAALVVALLVTEGCGGGIERGRALTDDDVRAALENLPFRYEYREVQHSGHGSVVAGQPTSAGTPLTLP
jgi:hypothetical protein